jgi:hypothetical protein
MNIEVIIFNIGKHNQQKIEDKYNEIYKNQMELDKNINEKDSDEEIPISRKSFGNRNIFSKFFLNSKNYFLDHDIQSIDFKTLVLNIHNELKEGKLELCSFNELNEFGKKINDDYEKLLLNEKKLGDINTKVKKLITQYNDMVHKKNEVIKDQINSDFDSI